MIQPTTPAEFRGTERFRVVRRIGSGGMGVVYEAFDCQRDARVALKFLPDADATALSRFKQEFRVLADVSGPHVVQRQSETTKQRRQSKTPIHGAVSGRRRVPLTLQARRTLFGGRADGSIFACR